MVSVIHLDPARQYQVMDGFGASGAWWAQDVGGWEDDKRGQIARLLFDRGQGIDNPPTVVVIGVFCLES